jgi:serine/threonine protein kinase
MTEEEIAGEMSAVRNLCNGAHSNIIAVLKFVTLRTPHAFYFIDMEYCDCNLYDYVVGVSDMPGLFNWLDAGQQERMQYVINTLADDMIDGLSFVHSKDLVHRDLSPQNGFGTTFQRLT